MLEVQELAFGDRGAGGGGLGMVFFSLDRFSKNIDLETRMRQLLFKRET